MTNWVFISGSLVPIETPQAWSMPILLSLFEDLCSFSAVTKSWGCRLIYKGCSEMEVSAQIGNMSVRYTNISLCLLL